MIIILKAAFIGLMAYLSRKQLDKKMDFKNVLTVFIIMGATLVVAFL